MSDLPRRLRASLRCDAINGDSFERGVCAKQMREAADSLERADARIAELERECAQWRDELRIYRETENARIAELEQSVTVRDTEIARLETDLELARRDAGRYRWLAKFPTYTRCTEYAGIPATKENIIAEYKQWSFAGPLAFMLIGETLDAAIDAARAGNGGVA